MPVATLFLRSTNQSLTAFFLVILMVTQFGSLCNSMLASAQMIWSMARDECIPFAKFWYKLHGDRKIPLRILILQAVICTIVIMPVTLKYSQPSVAFGTYACVFSSLLVVLYTGLLL